MRNLDNILGFIKIGKRKHLEQLQKGMMYFSPVSRFQKMEAEQINKGRGDINEGRNKLDAFNIKMIQRNPDGSTREILIPKSSIIFTYQGLEKTPIYCLIQITKENFKDGKIYINETDFNRICNELTDSDSALIILNTKEFIYNITENIGTLVYGHSVFYSDIETTEFLDFINENDKISTTSDRCAVRAVTTENVHKTLYKKNTYFKYQHEFRIVLPTEKIIEPKVYCVKPINNSIIVKLDCLKYGVEI